MHRQEHPEPQFLRENWVNFNGDWDFESISEDDLNNYASTVF